MSPGSSAPRRSASNLPGTDSPEQIGSNRKSSSSARQTPSTLRLGSFFFFFDPLSPLLCGSLSHCLAKVCDLLGIGNSVGPLII